MSATARKQEAAREASPLRKVNAELSHARKSRTQLDRHIAALERQRDRIRAGRQRDPRPSDALDPHSQAGPKNVELMRGVFKEGRTLTAAEATRRAGSEPGHQVWAIRALLAEGQIEETGFKVGVSTEYRWVGKRRRQTRMEPGS